MEKVLEKFRKFYKKRGVLGVIELLFHPFLTPLFLIPAWCKSLWNSRVLLYGQWSRYHGFHPRNTINCFFYKTQWLNFERYGRCGISPVVGLGNHLLSKWFHLTMFSSCLYANAGAVVTLGGTLIWVFSHLVWLSTAPWQWVVTVTMILFFSSTAYWMAFVIQNYNILGWMWLPLGFYAIATQQYALAGLMWLLTSFASFTAVVTVAIMLFFMMIFERDLYIGLTVVPAVLKLCLHLLPLLRTGRMKSSILNIAQLIGLTSNRRARYSRKASMKMNTFNLYFTCLYAFSCLGLWYAAHSLPVYPVIALILFFINQIVFRFADERSLILFFSTVLFFSIVQCNVDLRFLAIAFISFSPLPALLFGLTQHQHGRSIIRALTYRPFDHTALLHSMNAFFSHPPAGSRVVFAFSNPDGKYDKVFDGYRVILELALFSAAREKIHLFPDWNAVAETNSKEAPEFWGRTIEEVKENMSKWNADYVIIYSLTSDNIEERWWEEFTVVAEFDWSDWVTLLQPHLPWQGLAPKWHLLKPLASNSD